jgi:predicted XRE-type DNA-binding protein
MSQALRKKRRERHPKIAAFLKGLKPLRPRPKKRAATKVTEGSGNVFADIGIPSPEQHLLRAELVRRIALTMKEQDLTQTTAAQMLGVGQPDVSRMLQGHFRQFSVERLMKFLVALGQGVEIVVHRPAAKEDAKITVSAS